MQLAEHQEGSPNAPGFFFMETSGSVSHCAPRTSGKITIAPMRGLGLLLVGAHAAAIIRHVAYVRFPYPGNCCPVSIVRRRWNLNVRGEMQ